MFDTSLVQRLVQPQDVGIAFAFDCASADPQQLDLLVKSIHIFINLVYFRLGQTRAEAADVSKLIQVLECWLFRNFRMYP